MRNRAIRPIKWKGIGVVKLRELDEYIRVTRNFLELQWNYISDLIDCFGYCCTDLCIAKSTVDRVVKDPRMKT